ncbi:MAG: D-alanyl-D-alanine carboxypeptidase [Oscillospiraceae bacterium]|nr:D-alanyl-D-alanine carboxypeptidase [Oscillospiraceae bacterium]
MKRLICLLLVFFLFSGIAHSAPVAPKIVSPSAVVMERDTGKVIYKKDPHAKRPPASVTKVMTLLLVMEAIDSGKINLQDSVSVSEHAAGMGGSQVFLSPGEEMSVHDMLKATVIASGNDSAVALAEHIAGSEEGFVSLMNERAKQLGMKDTTFKNCTGLDAEGHLTSAYDIALMSRELIKHKKIKEYTTIWMDSLRNGAFTLANTNKLIRSYRGITGLKTGSTSVAKFCLAATAERDGMELIATIMAAPSGKERFSDASKLLDFGFANYALYSISEELSPDRIPVVLGNEDFVSLEFGSVPSTLIEKNSLSGIDKEFSIPDDVKAPVKQGQTIGTAKIFSNETLLCEVPIIAKNDVNRMSFGDIFDRIVSKVFLR